MIKSNLLTIEQNLPWYLVQCKPNAVYVAARNLENQSFTTFLPLQESTTRNGETFKQNIRPLFPGYLFVQLNPDKGPWHQVNNTRGVTRLVRLCSEPSVVPNSIVSALITRCGENGVLQETYQLRAGDKTQITRGPFSGFIATVGNSEPNDRIHVLLNIMGQSRNVLIDTAALTPVN